MKSADWGLGDAGSPRFFCQTCSHIEYVPLIWRGNQIPPDIARGKFAKLHKRTKCKGEIEYRAGVGASLRRLVEEQEKAP